MNLANRLLQKPDYHVFGDDGDLKVSRISLFTGRRNEMTLPITRDQLFRYIKGEGLIQQIFPDLTADQREFIQSGATPEEWNSMFGEGD